MHGLGVMVTIASGLEGQAHIGGVQRCGSPWACPICSPTIGERRARELDQAIAEHIRRGGFVLFVTATLSHTLRDRLTDLLPMVQTAWSRTWRWHDRPTWYRGQMRALEITHGANGWHPHVHAAIFVRDGSDLIQARQEVEGLRHRWAESVERLGGSTMVTAAADGKVPGWDVQMVTDAGALASYLTKVEGGWSAGHEIARPDCKSGRSGSRTPWELLDDAIDGDERAATLWSVYEAATFGRRRIDGTPGLLKDLDVEELTDDDAAVGDGPDATVVLVEVPAADWLRLLDSGWVPQLLDDIEDLATGQSDGWAWPPSWLRQHPT